MRHSACGQTRRLTLGSRLSLGYTRGQTDSTIGTSMRFLTTPSPVAPPSRWAERPLCRLASISLSWESALLVALLAAAALTRLWGLGARVMSHDESLHTYYSWRLATGQGFTHNPMMHGPSLFEATALMNALFGANDFTSRLVPALLGIAIVVVMPRLLRPWLGHVGAWAASVLLLISPYVLYYSR